MAVVSANIDSMDSTWNSTWIPWIPGGFHMDYTGEGKDLFEGAIHQPGRKDVFVKKGSWLSTREGAGCQQGRKLAVNKGGS